MPRYLVVEYFCHAFGHYVTFAGEKRKINEKVVKQGKKL